MRAVDPFGRPVPGVVLTGWGMPLKAGELAADYGFGPLTTDAAGIVALPFSPQLFAGGLQVSDWTGVGFPPGHGVVCWGLASQGLLGQEPATLQLPAGWGGLEVRWEGEPPQMFPSLVLVREDETACPLSLAFIQGRTLWDRATGVIRYPVLAPGRYRVVALPAGLSFAEERRAFLARAPTPWVDVRAGQVTAVRRVAP